MFLTSENYVEQVSKVVEESKSLSVAVAFWGKSSDSIFKSTKGLPIRIICNLMSGGTNPDPIRILRDTPGVEIRQMNDLHAKVIVGEKHAIVGSANFSTNGLNFENDENAGWQEAGLITSEVSQVNAAQVWFEKIWNDSRPIENYDLELAQLNWDLRRTNRHPTGLTSSLLSKPLPAIKDVHIYLAIWRTHADDEATKTFEPVKNEIQQSESPRYSSDQISFFDQWDDLPKKAFLISVEYKPRGGLNIDGAWMRIPLFDKWYGNEGEENQKSIQIIGREKLVNGWIFNTQDEKSLKKRLKPYIQDLWSRNCMNDGVCIPLYEFLLMEQS